jgi:hypothetical protein
LGRRETVREYFKDEIKRTEESLAQLRAIQEIAPRYQESEMILGDASVDKMRWINIAKLIEDKERDLEELRALQTEWQERSGED